MPDKARADSLIRFLLLWMETIFPIIPFKGKLVSVVTWPSTSLVNLKLIICQSNEMHSKEE